MKIGEIWQLKPANVKMFNDMKKKHALEDVSLGSLLTGVLMSNVEIIDLPDDNVEFVFIGSNGAVNKFTRKHFTGVYKKVYK